MAVYININDPVVGESANFVDFVLTLSAASSNSVSVPYSTASLLADSYTDFTPTSGTVVFPPGSLTQTVRVILLPDTRVESSEAFALTLGTPTNALLTRTSGQALIVDNDTLASPTQRASLSVRDLTVDEGAGTASFIVMLDKAASSGFSVSYSTVNGSAVAGADYGATSGTLDFAAGETSKIVTVAISNDGLRETEESFSLSLGLVSGQGAASVQIADGTGQAAIGRNDHTTLATPVISVANAIVSENAGYVEFVVSLNGAGANEVRVNFSTNALTADSYTDLEPYSGVLIFAPGITTQTLRVALYDGTNVEELELLLLSLSNPVNAVISASNGSATVVDNDKLADSSNPAGLLVRGVTVDESAGTATFSVMLDKAVADSFSVAYSTAGGSATAGGDFTANQGTLTFGPGETVKTVTVELIDDSVAELEELFFLNLGAISGNAAASVQVSQGTGQATIGRNDQTALASPVISARDAVASEGDGYIEFVVSLSAPGIAQVSVGYNLVSNTATLYNDIEPLSGTLVFAPGVTTQTLRVALVGGTGAEGLEQFILSLGNAVNGVVGHGRSYGTIIDNDTPADPSNVANLSVRDVTVDEKAGTATFTVLLDKAANNSFSVAYSTANGSARDASDFTGAQGSLSFAAGQTVRTVTVNLGDDSLAELDEFFFLNLGVVTGKAADMVRVADGQGQAMIGRSDQTPVGSPIVSVANAIVGEGEGYVEVRVSLSAPALNLVSVNYVTSSKTADIYNDFEPSSGTLVFAPGSTTQTFRVAILDSTAAESKEMFYVSLGNAVNATIGSPDATVIVIDNDTLADSISPATLSVGDVVVNEAAGTVSFDVVLKGATNSGFTVAYSTVDGSAVAGTDYSARLGTLVFAAGETVKTVTVNLLADGLPEHEEIFGLQLGAIGGASADTVQISDGLGQAFIGRNGLPLAATPAISIASVSTGEADGYAEFVVRLSAPSSSLVAVNYSTTSGSASTYNDFEPTSGTLRFAPGVTAQTVRIAITADTIAEGNETFTFNLGNVSNATIATSSATVTIVDNDTLADTLAPAILSVQAVSVNENAGTATFVLSLSKANMAAFNVAYSTVDGTATAGSDFAAASGVIGFAAGETVKLVTVSLVADPYAEASETFQLRLDALTGAGAAAVTLQSNSATATIADVGSTSFVPVLSASASTVTEGNSVTFSLANTGLAAGTQLPYNLAGISAARMAQPVNGTFTIDSSGNASVTFDFLDNLSTDLTSVLLMSTPGTSMPLTLTDAVARSGTAGNDALLGTTSNDKIDGGAGVDTLTYGGASTNYDITRTTGGYLVNDVSGANGRDLLVNVERLVFADKAIALDISGTAGQVYRIYQAAFDRQPDQAGVGFWMAQMDRGLSLEAIAAGFVDSAEFVSVFGLNPSTEAFVSKVYSNVLHRAPDAAGYAFWVGAVNSGVSMAVMLAAVSESAENQAQVIGTIQNGFEYLPYF